LNFNPASVNSGQDFFSNSGFQCLNKNRPHVLMFFQWIKLKKTHHETILVLPITKAMPIKTHVLLGLAYIYHVKEQQESL